MNSAQVRKALSAQFGVNDADLTDWARQEPYMNYMLHVAAPKDKDDLNRILIELAMRKGKTRDQAALYLGITHDSFAMVADSGKVHAFVHQGGEIYFEFILNSFMSSYLEPRTLYSNQTSQRVAFIKAFNAKHKDEGMQLRPEVCAAKDNHIAAELCSNPACIPGETPRRVCLAHGIFIDTRKPGYLRPDILCHVCAEAEMGKPPAKRDFIFMQDDSGVRAWLERKKHAR